MLTDGILQPFWHRSVREAAGQVFFHQGEAAIAMITTAQSMKPLVSMQMPMVMEHAMRAIYAMEALNQVHPATIAILAQQAISFYPTAPAREHLQMPMAMAHAMPAIYAMQELNRALLVTMVMPALQAT